MKINEQQHLSLISLSLIAGILGAAALHWLRPVMIPFILAFFFSYLLSPVIDVLMRRFFLPRGLAIFSALLLGLLLAFLLVGLISSSVQQLAQNGPAYARKFQLLSAQATASLADRGIEVGIESLQAELESLPLAQLLMKVTRSLLDTLSTTFLVLIFVIYLLQGRTSKGSRGEIKAQIDDQIRRYIGLKVGLSAITGISVALLLWLLGVDLALLFGLLAFLLNFIPSVGSVIATLLPLPVILLSPELSVWTALWALLLPGAVQITVGNIIEPRLQGDSLNLHPITILLALIFWGMLWGIPGMFLGTPITAALRILFNQIPLTQPVARLMAGEI